MSLAESNLTVGMSAYGNVETIRKALECLRHSINADWEVILVDDCSPDGGAVLNLFKEFKKDHHRSRIFHFQKNLEYSGSLNAIFSHASDDDILFLSNDIYSSPAYIRELLTVARSNKRFGIVRGVSNFVDNAKQSHNISVPAIKVTEDHFKFAENIEHQFQGQTIIDEYLTGDAFLVKRSVIQKIGTVDKNFYGYFADHDLGIRAQAAGFDLVLARRAFAFHQRDANFEYLPPGERQKKLQLRWARVIENWARFKIKYGLPVELVYTSINDIPWALLPNRIADNNIPIPPEDYSRFEILS
jgi:GT2 family glycosyltransferase